MRSTTRASPCRAKRRPSTRPSCTRSPRTLHSTSCGSCTALRLRRSYCHSRRPTRRASSGCAGLSRTQTSRRSGSPSSSSSISGSSSRRTSDAPSRRCTRSTFRSTRTHGSTSPSGCLPRRSTSMFTPPSARSTSCGRRRWWGRCRRRSARCWSARTPRAPTSRRPSFPERRRAVAAGSEAARPAAVIDLRSLRGRRGGEEARQVARAARRPPLRPARARNGRAARRRPTRAS
mmetsp:Transcript_13367/g.43604  ORF Transcript_13367/g.43604 Transcript_13367/m.43604 type:complete len:233 (+) Transcript_13367:601-1299(+)